MTDALHSILQYAESLEMPEGQYLKVANALRDTFHQMPKKNVIHHWTEYPFPDNYLKVRLRKPSCVSSCEEICITYLNVQFSNARRPGPSRIRMKVRVEYVNQGEPTVTKETTHSEQIHTFDTIYELYEPTQMVIECDGVSYVYDCEPMLQAMKKEHDRTRRINRDEEAEDDDDDEIYWNDTNFYHAVFGRVMNIGKNYFWMRFHEEHDD